MNRTKVGLTLAAGAVLVATVAGCGDKQQEYFKDAPRSDTDWSAAKIITMPDGFSNLATKCVDGDRYTVVFHSDGAYGAVSVVADDPSCNRK